MSENVTFLQKEVKELQSRLKDATELLSESVVQIKYLHTKFLETGTGKNVIKEIENFLND